jgi:hypothetical protein
VLIRCLTQHYASNNRTSQQIADVHRWGDTPLPIIWNNMLAEYIKRNNIGLFDFARALAYLNVAMHDAAISTWYTKYTYWTARPFQRIANFTSVITTPVIPHRIQQSPQLHHAAVLLTSTGVVKAQEESMVFVVVFR